MEKIYIVGVKCLVIGVFGGLFKECLVGVLVG